MNEHQSNLMSRFDSISLYYYTISSYTSFFIKWLSKKLFRFRNLSVSTFQPFIDNLFTIDNLLLIFWLLSSVVEFPAVTICTKSKQKHEIEINLLTKSKTNF